MSNQIEVELVARSKYGDQNAFSKLIQKYSNVILSVAYSGINDFHEAQDIAQETFVKAWFNMEQLHDHERFGAWIIRITRNLCTDRQRKHQLVVSSLIEVDEVPDDLSLEEQVDRNSEKETVWKAIAKLDEKYRTTILMYYIGGFNSREISRLLDVPVGTTESRLRRSKAILKKELIELVESTANERKLDKSFIGKVRARIKSASFVFLVENLQESVAFYEGIGFLSENIGGHVHVSHGGAVFILHEANQKDVRPYSAADNGLYFDAFCYTDPESLRNLFDFFQTKNIEIVDGPHWTDGWSEMTIRDNNGYRIAFGA
ncbi:sigma-70 family RNA polymerase sigma factor [Paenibacillus cellulositrophicus]|uniref:sigma-70 family RNA polymerase sigma factor n=1 Tax=Paenibacillus cellulositrophicus TaxID=562959 RepID=UPI003F7F531C